MVKKRHDAREDQTSFGEDLTRADHERTRRFLRQQQKRAGRTEMEQEWNCIAEEILSRMIKKILGDYNRDAVREYMEKTAVIDYSNASLLDLDRDLKALAEMGVNVYYEGVRGDKDLLKKLHKNTSYLLKRDLGIGRRARQNRLWENP